MIKPTKASDIKITWHLIDAKDQILGRLATRIIPLLLGKSKPYFVENLDCGDHIVVINSSQIKVTGRKELQKKYYSYSGYPGGLKETTFSKLKQTHPERILENAITKMLPKNKLRSLWLKKLHVFANVDHPFADKFKVEEERKTNEKRN